MVEAGRKEEKSHQRVVKTRWWLWRPAFAGGKRALAGLRQEEVVEGGEAGRKEEKSHQRVVKTCWWLWRPAFAGGK